MKNDEIKQELDSDNDLKKEDHNYFEVANKKKNNDNLTDTTNNEFLSYKN